MSAESGDDALIPTGELRQKNKESTMSTQVLGEGEKVALRSVLSDGEAVRWYVRPRCIPEKKELQHWILLTLVMTIFSGFFILVSLGSQEVDTVGYLIASFCMLLVGLTLLIPVLTVVNRRRTFYAVTNRHAVVAKSRLPLPGWEMTLYPLASNMVVEIVERKGGRGDIVLAYENTAPDAFGRRPRLGFLNLSDMGSVLEALQTTAAAFPPRTDAEHSRSLSWADPRSSVQPPEKCWGVISVVMIVGGTLALYAGISLAEEPLEYFLKAERTVGKVVRAEKDGDAYRPIYEYTVADGRRYCREVKDAELFQNNPKGRETVLLYFADAPEEAHALSLVNLFAVPLFLTCWGLMFLSGGCLTAKSYRYQKRVWGGIEKA